MQRLAEARELLDGDLDETDELVGNLRDLRRINRILGGVTLTSRALDALLTYARLSDRPSATKELSLLDIGTGGADIPAALLRTRAGLSVTAVDSRPEVLRAAVRLDPQLATESRLTLRVADGLDLPYEDGAFDVAHASMVLHHLEPEDSRRLLREMARVARLGIVVNDLARGRLQWLGAWTLLHLATRNRFTRHDGPLSVRRSYSASEARTLASDAGLTVIHEGHGRLRHRWALAAVRE